MIHMNITQILNPYAYLFMFSQYEYVEWVYLALTISKFRSFEIDKNSIADADARTSWFGSYKLGDTQKEFLFPLTDSKLDFNW